MKNKIALTRSVREFKHHPSTPCVNSNRKYPLICYEKSASKITGEFGFVKKEKKESAKRKNPPYI